MMDSQQVSKALLFIPNVPQVLSQEAMTGIDWQCMLFNCTFGTNVTALWGTMDGLIYGVYELGPIN